MGGCAHLGTPGMTPVDIDATVRKARPRLCIGCGTRRSRGIFEVVSELVHLESADGDPDAAARRAGALAGLRSVEIAPEAEVLAAALLQGAALPMKARADALHIAIAATQGVSYLLIWSSAHIADAERRPVVEAVCRGAGYEPPIICTPDELMGEESPHVDVS